jgi:hypothetical protein
MVVANRDIMKEKPALKYVYLLQKDSKNIFQLDILQNKTRQFKCKINNAFPHNF